MCYDLDREGVQTSQKLNLVVGVEKSLRTTVLWTVWTAFSLATVYLFTTIGPGPSSGSCQASWAPLMYDRDISAAIKCN